MLPLTFSWPFNDVRPAYRLLKACCMKNASLDRREFTRISLLSMFAGVTVTISGCGGGGGGSNSPNTPTTGRGFGWR